MKAKYHRMYAYIEGKRDRELEKLSPAMWRLLWEANAFGGRAPYDNMRLSTRRALNGKKLMDGWKLTALGRRALCVQWKPTPSTTEEQP